MHTKDFYHFQMFVTRQKIFGNKRFVELVFGLGKLLSASCSIPIKKCTYRETKFLGWNLFGDPLSLGKPSSIQFLKQINSEDFLVGHTHSKPRYID
jgi:hypothetical protein